MGSHGIDRETDNWDWCGEKRWLYFSWPRNRLNNIQHNVKQQVEWYICASTLEMTLLPHRNSKILSREVLPQRNRSLPGTGSHSHVDLELTVPCLISKALHHLVQPFQN